MKKNGFLLVFLFLITTIHAQNSPRFLLGFEFGEASVKGELNDEWSVRQDINPYSDYYNYSSGVSNVSSITYFGIKPEVTSYSGRLSLSSGLRFSQLNSSLSGGINGEYYFLRYKSDQTSSEYARVSSLSEKVNYLSVPLEFRFVPVQISNFGFYGKIGTEIGLKLSSKKSIEFTSETMKPYQEEVLNTNPVKANSLYSTLYGAIGVRWESLRGTNVNMELLLPSKFLTENNLTLITPTLFSGFQFSVQFPLHDTK